jgi:hypothetical protein
MQLRQVESIFMLSSLLALVACMSRLVPDAAPSFEPTRSLADPMQDRLDEVGTPVSCVADDEESQPFLNAADGYCLRFPTGFRLGEVLPGIANFYGPPRTPDLEPLAAGLVIRAENLSQGASLQQAVDAYVEDQQRLGWLSPSYTQSTTWLGGQPAVLLQGPGEYTPLHILVTVHRGKRYTLSFWPDSAQFPLVAADVHALWETTKASFSFLNSDGRALQASAPQRSSVARR